MIEKFFMGLDSEIGRMVEAKDPKTYEEALRTAKALEKPKEERHRESMVTIGRKRPYEPRETDHQPPARRSRYADRCPARYVDVYPRDLERIQELEKPLCRECEKQHWGKCMAKSRTCFRCGREGHMAKYYTKKGIENIVKPPRGSGSGERTV